MFFDFVFDREKKWNESLRKIAEGKITVQEFVDTNEKKVLFYTIPVITDKDGNNCINAISFPDNENTYMPAFSKVDSLKLHYDANGLVPGVIIKGDLKSFLAALDSHPMLREWGAVIDPDSPKLIGIPPHIRITPKCLRG